MPADFTVGAAGARAGAPSAYADGRINQIIDPLVYLAAAAAATTNIKLGTGICLVPERNPIRLAKEVATLDLISGGRFLFGIGRGLAARRVGNFGRRLPPPLVADAGICGGDEGTLDGPDAGILRALGGLSAAALRPQTGAKSASAGVRGRRAAGRGAKGGGLRRRLAASRPQYVTLQRPRPPAGGPRPHRGIVPRQRPRSVNAEHYDVGRAARPGAEPAAFSMRGRIISSICLRPAGNGRHWRGWSRWRRRRWASGAGGIPGPLFYPTVNFAAIAWTGQFGADPGRSCALGRCEPGNPHRSECRGKNGHGAWFGHFDSVAKM